MIDDLKHHRAADGFDAELSDAGVFAILAGIFFLALILERLQ